MAARSEKSWGTRASPDKRALLSYFRSVGPELLRRAVGPFKFPSIAPSLPGKEYSAELWDWDTLWTARGLFRLAYVTHDNDFKARVGEHALGSVRNFFDHQSPDGRLPIVMSSMENFVIPPLRNQAKPVMAQLALLIADEMNTVEWLSPYFDGLMRFHEAWIAGNQNATGLLVWGDDVAIGDDNDPTTFGRPFFSSANLLLNCLWYADLKAAKTLSGRLARPSEEQRMLTERIKNLEHAIQKECWDRRDSFFYTVDVQSTDKRAELLPDFPRGMSMSWSTVPLRIQTFTGFLPLWCGLATPLCLWVDYVYKELNRKTFIGNLALHSVKSSRNTRHSFPVS